MANEYTRRAGRLSEQPLHGRYLEEKLRSLNWEQLADRTAPLPDDIPLDVLTRRFENLYALQYDDWAEQIYHIPPLYKRQQR